MNDNKAVAYIDEDGDLSINIELALVSICIAVEENKIHIYCLDKKTNQTMLRVDDLKIIRGKNE